MATLNTTSLVAFALLAPLASAQTLSGKVVDPSGVGVFGVNVDVTDQITGQDVPLVNDGTDITGAFSVDVPAGLYTVILFPPVPPTTTLLVGTVADVLVTGPTDIGTITLTQGVALSGRVLRAGGIPVSGMDLDVIDKTTGVDINPPGDTTDAFGQFLMAVPTTPIEVQMEPNPAGFPLLAPESFDMKIGVDTNMGDTMLSPGFTLSAVVQRTNGTPIKAADLDATDIVTGIKRFTPTDNTDANGFVDVVVPAGSYEINLCAPVSQRLVSTIVSPVAVNADTNLGVVQMAGGVVLSGTVTAANGGATIAGTDLDLFFSATGLSSATCNDNTDANGNYAVVAPLGTFDVIFSPDYDTLYGSTTKLSVTITGDLTLDAVLPDCCCSQRVGVGTPGTGGFVPRLKTIGGSYRLGNSSLRLRVTQGRGGAMALVMVGLAPGPGGGVIGGNLSLGASRDLLPPTPIVLSGLAGMPGVGEGGMAFPLPDDPSLAGLTMRMGAVVFDPVAPAGRALARRVEGVICE
jgi:hypothetical protein